MGASAVEGHTVDPEEEYDDLWAALVDGREALHALDGAFPAFG